MTEENTNFINFTDDIFLNSKAVYQETDNELLNYALHYAKSGYPVIPLHNVVKRYGILQCSCNSGLECSTAGKHPRNYNGSKGAPLNENIIFDWWDKSPEANIGLLTGKESGIFVLDIDKRIDNCPAYDGEFLLDFLNDDYRFMKSYTPFPATLTAFSGSGSRHLYFKYTLDLPIKNSASEIASDVGLGLDIKSDGNYIVAPPSNHKSGNKYQWFGVNTPIEDAPKWLIYEIQKAMQSSDKKSISKRPAFSQEISDEKIPVGKRNDYLFRQICGLLNNNSKEEVTRRALEINDKKFSEPMKEKEILRMINWCLKKYRKSGSDNMRLKK